MSDNDSHNTSIPPATVQNSITGNSSNRRNRDGLLSRERAEFQPGAKLPDEEVHFSLFAKRLTVIVLVALLVVFLLRVAGDLPPFIWAIVTAYVLNRPLCALVNRTSWPRWSWAVIFYLVFFGLLGLLLAWVVPNVSHEARQLTQSAPKIKAQVDDYLMNNDTVNIVGIAVSTDTVSNTINTTIDTVTKQAKTLAPTALTVTFRLIIDFLLYLVVTFYLLLSGGSFISHGINALPLKLRSEMHHLMLRIDRVLSAYIRGQFILIGIMTAASFIILTVLGVDYAFVLAIMTGVLELVPYIGPYLAMAVAGAVAYFQPHANFGLNGVLLTTIVVICYFVVRQIEDYAVVPAVIGKIVELPGILVIFAILVGATILGPIGLLLAVPISATIKIILGYLFYKLVDADREKLDLRNSGTMERLLDLLQSRVGGRVLIETGEDSPYLHEPQNVARLKQIEIEQNTDIAIDTGNEKLAHQLREQGFPIVTLAQEHFLSNKGR